MVRIKNLKSRKVEDGVFYITEKEAISICNESDPKKHFIGLPNNGWERRVRFNNKWWWLGKKNIDGKCFWIIKLIT